LLTTKFQGPLIVPELRFSEATVTLFEIVTVAPLVILATPNTPGTPAGFQLVGLNQSLEVLPTQKKFVLGLIGEYTLMFTGAEVASAPTASVAFAVSA